MHKPFSLLSYFSRSKSPTDSDGHSVASSNRSGGVALKHGTIHGNVGVGSQNIRYEAEHKVFDSDDLDSEGQSDSFSMQSTTTTSLHSNRSSNMQSFSISKPVLIDDAASRHKSTNSVSSPFHSGRGPQQLADSGESDFKIGSYGSGRSPESGNGGWRTFSTEDLQRFRQESAEYSELIYRVNSFGTNSRQDSQSTLGTLHSAMTFGTAGSANTGGTGADEESQGGEGEREVHRMGFFGTLFRSKK